MRRIHGAVIAQVSCSTLFVRGRRKLKTRKLFALFVVFTFALPVLSGCLKSMPAGGGGGGPGPGGGGPGPAKGGGPGPVGEAGDDEDGGPQGAPVAGLVPDNQGILGDTGNNNNGSGVIDPSGGIGAPVPPVGGPIGGIGGGPAPVPPIGGPDDKGKDGESIATSLKLQVHAPKGMPVTATTH